MTHFLSTFLSLVGLVDFLAGIFTVVAWRWLKARWTGEKVHFNQLLLGWVLITAAVLYVGVQTRDAHDQAVAATRQATAVAVQTQTCERALKTWLTTLLNPPPDIAKLPINDPTRQAWGVSTTKIYLATPGCQ